MKTGKALLRTPIFDMIAYIVGAPHMATMDQAKCEEGFWGQKALEYNRDRNNICGTANGDRKFKAYKFEHDNRVYKVDTQGASEAKVLGPSYRPGEVYWTGAS
jgi:hypothetical protein